MRKKKVLTPQSESWHILLINQQQYGLVCINAFPFADQNWVGQWPVNDSQKMLIYHHTYLAKKSYWKNYYPKNCALVGHDAACSGNSLPTFRDNLSDPSSRVKNLDP